MKTKEFIENLTEANKVVKELSGENAELEKELEYSNNQLLLAMACIKDVRTSLKKVGFLHGANSKDIALKKIEAYKVASKKLEKEYLGK